MADKYRQICELYSQICNKVVTSPKDWRSFLSSACRNYKLRFDEQLLVYAQRPDATAVLEVHKWSDKFGRWVNRGANGIAVFEDANNEKQRLIHYFDISDTRTTTRSKPVPIWRVDHKYDKKIIEALERSFGPLDNKNTLANAIRSASYEVVNDNIEDDFASLLALFEGSKLKGLDYDSIYLQYKTLTVNSVAYMIMSRLDITTSAHFTDDDFINIVNFNTEDTLSALGFTTSKATRITLNEIAKTVALLNKHTLENSHKEDYNIGRDITGRSLDNGETELHPSRRLQHSEPSVTGTATSESRQIRTIEKNLSKGTPCSDLLQLSHEGQADRTSLRSGGQSTEIGRNSNQTDGTDRRLDRGIEEQGHREMGGADEQSQKLSSGDSLNGSDLRLIQDIKPLPSIEEQLSIINSKAEETISSAFSVPQQIIDDTLTMGSGFVDGKMRIYEQYQKKLTNKENADFLKHEYGIGGSPIRGYEGYHQKHDGKGILIDKGYDDDRPKVLLKWTDVASRIEYLIDTDRYLNPKEKEMFPQWLEKELIERENTARIIAEKRQTMAVTLSNEKSIEPEFTYEYGLGDKVYIGANELEIIHVDNNKVLLYNTQFPLFNEEMSRTEFDKRVAENPMNEHLRVQKTSTQENGLAKSYTDAFYVDTDANNVTWMYYNADSYAGGQYVTNVIEFSKIEEAINTCKNDEEFFDYLESVANQTLADIDTEWFKEAESKFSQKPDFKNCSQETMQSLINLVSSEPKAQFNLPNNIPDDYSNIKSDFPDNLLLFEVDAFYEAYYDDAEKIADITKLISTNRIDSTGNSVPVVTIPEDALESNVTLLNQKGHTVCILVNENDELKMYDIVPVNNEDTKQSISNLPKDKHTSPLAYQEVVDNDVSKSNQHSSDAIDERHNFDLSNHPIEEVGKKERFKRNMDAIRVLKECEFENRLATPEEQLTLSKYVGWGGIPEAFDETNSSWSNEFKELIVALSPEEYAHAKESTLTAFYTPQNVIKAIYNAMEQFGFKNGNILEPSCGIGHFIGMLPDSMKEAKIYGVELDTISAGIAQQLYQTSNIAAQGFEETNLPDSFFDGVIGNVPFGDFKVLDKRYDKHNFLIHDYFFAKSLDKLRPGGIMALITSKGTMDKENCAVRKYIAQRAELLGAIRLPNNTFKGNAGTQVVSDILFLQKRDRLIEPDVDWINLGIDNNGIKMNNYFIDNPEMVLGEMKVVSGRFKMEATCIPLEGEDLEKQLENAIKNIQGKLTAYETQSELNADDNSIPADPTVRNFSYTILDDTIYYRENSRMTPIEASATGKQRIKGMISIRDSVRQLIDLQKENHPDAVIKAEQENLNNLYDTYTKKYGLLNSRGNKSAFSDDSSYYLLTALEIINEDGELERKADIFYKRTIKPHTPVTSVETASEALAISMGEKATIDIEYMTELTGKPEQELFEDLKGVIFLNPMHGYGNQSEQKYLTADEYLSGNVREKLVWAKRSAEQFPDDYSINVEALTRVQPKDLSASEISVRLGATWLPVDVVQDFMCEFFETPTYLRKTINVQFSPYTGDWNITCKTYNSSNVKITSTYGTKRINAYRILEDTLNLKDVAVYDYVEENGKQKAILNRKETAVAQSKQELIKQGFQDWVWTDAKRRERLTTLYNEKFNSIRAREYDGSNITFNNMNPEIALFEHQQNAVARILYGGNTLLAHTVGAGKTYTMISAAMELKRLGLCTKSMFVVPNHLTEQWASEFLQLYPSANILVTTKKDFERKNRKRFCARIATGDYDAIIIGHSQFEKIPMSIERQISTLEQQIDEITDGILTLKYKGEDNFSIKQLEKTKKQISLKLQKLNDQSRKDDLVTFEELGVDELFVDESHFYKNLYLYTKMRNVGGIAQTEAQKSNDLYMKCRYLDEITGGRGVVFATGTPISNSMVELYTIQRYLQYNTLCNKGLQYFDAWASTFGETVTAIELSPEGTGYRAKTRFARFYNLPELMTMFKEVADIQTADMLNLPVPKSEYHIVAVKPSDIQREMVASLAERAEAVRQSGVDSSVDNMLKITNDGRKLALDQRMMNELLPDFEGSKVNACVNNIYRIWAETQDAKSTQLVFCDVSTPKKDGSFNVYDDIRNKLISKGVPENEIQFIHEANTDIKKKELFQKTRKGEVRVLLGSTQKMGAGTNVQDRLIALHDLDCPWRPSDLEQRAGRIVRQGNQNEKVDIFRYVTEETFDAYLYQLVEGKQKFAGQIMTSKSPVRIADDIDEAALSYAEIKMLATGNPYIKEKMDLDIQVQKLKLLKANHLTEKYRLEDMIIKFYPQRIAYLTSYVSGLENDLKTVNENPRSGKDVFSGMLVNNIYYSERSTAGNALIAATKGFKSSEPVLIGKYRGLDLAMSCDMFAREFRIYIKGYTSTMIDLSTDNVGNIVRIDNAIDKCEERLNDAKLELINTQKQLETAKIEVTKPFTHEEELKSKTERLDELNILLNLDKKSGSINESQTSNTPQQPILPNEIPSSGFNQTM